jgi:hypothetical protein
LATLLIILLLKLLLFPLALPLLKGAVVVAGRQVAAVEGVAMGLS